jgi:Beta-propeller repeat
VKLRSRTLRATGLTLVTLSAAGLCRAPSASAQHSAEGSLPTRSTRALLPESSLRFEPNVGQFDPRVRYLARGKGYGLYLTAEGATLLLRSGESASKPRADHALQALPSGDRDDVVLSMHLVGEKKVEPVGAEPQSGADNYFMGSDRAQWRSGVQSYASVRYDDVLPGVSVIYYGKSGRDLEYDLLLAPGVDPLKVELAFEGVESIQIDADGSALLRLPGGQTLRKPPPHAFQRSASGQLSEVSSRYQQRPGGKLGFVVGPHDATRELVIDPVLLYSTYVGGSSTDEAFGVATDPQGNTYVVGYTASTLFPTVSPEQAVLGGGTFDAFVCKLDASGSFVYSTFLGGNGTDVGYAIAADGSGNAYVTGVTYSSNFPTVSRIQSSPGGMQDVFVAKLNSAGSALVYSTYLGGSQDDSPGGIAVSAFGNAYLTGTTNSSNFPVKAALQPTPSGSGDAFVSSITPTGSALAYSTYLGGSGSDFGHAIAVDGSGNAFVGGTTASTNFPTVTPFQSAFGGGSYDGFVSKLNPAGSALVYSTYLGGVFTEEVLGVASSSSGIATVAGYTSSTNFPVVSPVQPALGSNGFSDAFVTRFSVAGNGLSFSTYLGGSDDDRASSVAVDAAGHTYVVGSTLSTNFPILQPIAGQSAYRGASDGFVSAFDPSGATLSYSTYLGGAAEDHAVGVAVQANGTTHVAGTTFSTNFPVLLAPISALVGSDDAFVTRLPGVLSAPVPAFGWWSVVFCSGLLLGLGLLLLPLSKRTA